jgi:hypothetical protein
MLESPKHKLSVMLLSTVCLATHLMAGSGEGAVVDWRPALVAAPASEAVVRRYRGRVVRVNKGRLVVQLKWKGRKTFIVDKEARITRNGKRVALRRLRRRDQVRITAKVHGDRRMVTVLHAWAPLL